MEELNENQKYAVACVNKLKEFVKGSVQDFIYLGLLLKESQLYLKNIPDKNYKDIYDFAKSELNLCRSNVKYYISVQKRFGSGMNVKKEYEGYLFSQLREMVSLSIEQLELVNKSMTIEQIRSLKKINKEKENLLKNNLIVSEKLINLKNENERKLFLENYQTWELFKEIPELTLKFYRIKLSNNVYIYATQSEYHVYEKQFLNKINYSLFNMNNENARYSITGDSITTIVGYLTTNKLGYYKVV